MARTYKAVLSGDRVEWLDQSPETDEPIPVHIIVPDTTQRQLSQPAGSTAGALLRMLADRGAFADITDPVSWQREQRKDRPLPYHDCDAD